MQVRDSVCVSIGCISKCKKLKFVLGHDCLSKLNSMAVDSLGIFL